MASQQWRQVFKFRKTLVGLAVLCVFVAFGYSNCIPTTSGYLGNQASTGVLTVYPSTATVAPGGVQPFMAGGGTSPYTYQITYGGGTVSASGVYTAPAYTGTATLQVTDSTSKTAIASITVQTGGGGGGGGPTYYQCQSIPSSNCSNISTCESTCIGDLSPNSTCYYYNGSTQMISQCTQVLTPTTVNYCEVQYSYNNCTSASGCQSTCMGQYQQGGTCTYYVGSTQEFEVCSTTGAQLVALYSCPVYPSQNCSNTSLCESECVGQYSFLSTCNYYTTNGVAVPVQCTFIGNYTY